MDEAGRQEQQHIIADLHQRTAKRIVFDYVKAILEKTDTHVTFSIDEVYVVWFAKTLQNWKALISTTLPDQMYYEVTYDGDKNRVYLDAYKKWENCMYLFSQDGEPFRVWTKDEPERTA